MKRACVIGVCLCLAVLPASAMVDSVSLLQVLPGATPRVEKGNLSYSLDLIFSHCPRNIHSFYDDIRGKVVVNCYDTYIIGPEHSFRKHLPYSKLTIENSASRRSITGVLALLKIDLENTWQFTTTQIDDTTLRIIFQRPVERKIRRTNSRWVVWGYFILAAGAALVSLTIVLLASE